MVIMARTVNIARANALLLLDPEFPGIDKTITGTGTTFSSYPIAPATGVSTAVDLPVLDLDLF